MTGEREVYLDHAAATPVSESVLEEMLPYLTDSFHNPSAPYARARAARAALEEARARVAHLLGSRPGNVTFCAGATEANNLALASAKGPLVTDAIEHESVREVVRARGGTIVRVDEEGFVDLGQLAGALTAGAALVSVSYANGEIGTVQPVREICRLAATERMRRLEAGDARPLIVHTDASQAAGQLTLAVSTLKVDALTLSAAKVYGPKQVGVLWHADGVEISPFMMGGGQEGGLRSGTENVAGAVGMARALEDAERLRKAEVRRLRGLTRRLRARLADMVPKISFQGPAKESSRLASLVHVSVSGVDARRLVYALEERGVSVATGSACAASKMRVSETLTAIGLTSEATQGSLRLSLGRETEAADVDYAAWCIAEVVRAERERTASRAR